MVEQIVGDIEDEYDREEKTARKVTDSLLLVDGSASLRDLADEYDITLPRDAGYETLAGFLLERLGKIPIGGESFVFDRHRFTVVEMTDRRVSKVRVERLPRLAMVVPKAPSG